jgi:hypothetical protein
MIERAGSEMILPFCFSDLSTVHESAILQSIEVSEPNCIYVSYLLTHHSPERTVNCPALDSWERKGVANVAGVESLFLNLPFHHPPQRGNVFLDELVDLARLPS